MTNKNDVGGSVNNILATLKDNPKAMYGVIGAVVAIIIMIVMGSTKTGELGAAKVLAVVPGQQVVIKNPNVGNTILTNAPKLSSSDEDDDQVICRQVAAGTTAVVEDEAVSNYLSFVKVTLNDGECQGKIGWVPKVNISSQK